MRYRYVHDGPPEVFPDPPIARLVESGDEVETDDLVEHPNLRLVDGPPLSAFWVGSEEIPTPPPVAPAPADTPLAGPEPAVAPAPEPTT